MRISDWSSDVCSSDLRAACEARLPVGLIDALIMQESRYNPSALSPKGAFGLGQLMPATARQLGVDRYDLMQNLTGTAMYLAQQLDELRSEEHTSELQSLMRITNAVFSLKKKKKKKKNKQRKRNKLKK